jgi:hypothetical protein
MVWDVGILLYHNRNGKLPERLAPSEVMTRTAALLKMFVPLRPIALIRLDFSEKRTRKIVIRWRFPPGRKLTSKKRRLGR